MMRFSHHRSAAESLQEYGRGMEEGLAVIAGHKHRISETTRAGRDSTNVNSCTLTPFTADRFYLLDLVVKSRGYPTPGAGSGGAGEAGALERLLQVWQENMVLSLTVDDLFRERGMMVDEHLPQTLMRWMEEGMEKAAGKNP